MKKLLIIACVAIMSSSCSKRDKYKDISSAGLDHPTCPNQPSPRFHSYYIDIVDDSIYIYNPDDETIIGKTKMEGEFKKFDSLYNE